MLLCGMFEEDGVFGGAAASVGVALWKGVLLEIDKVG